MKHHTTRTAMVAFLLLCCHAALAQEPVISLTGDHDLNAYDIYKDYVINIEVTAPEVDEVITLTATTNDFPEEFFSFSPALPLMGKGSLSTQLQLNFNKYSYRSLEIITLTATDASGNKTERTLIFYVTRFPELIAPTDTVIVCINQPIDITFYWSEGEQVVTYWPDIPGSQPFGNLTFDFLGIIATVESTFAKEEDIGVYKLGLRVTDYDSGISINNEDVVVKVVDCSKEVWAFDDDKDGYGDRPYDNIYHYTTQGYPAVVNNNLDCNDKDAQINPAAEEIAADGIDNNCNGLVDEGSSCFAAQALKLTARCAEVASMRNWMIYNPNDCAVEVAWWVHKTAQKGSMIAPPGYAYFSSAAVNKNDVVFISWTDTGGKVKKKAMASSSAKCGKGKNKNSRTAEASEGLSAESLLAYPVPFSNSLNLRYPEISETSSLKVILTSVEGRQFDISSRIISKTRGSVSLDLGSTRISQGLYLLQLQVNDQKPVYIKVMKEL